VKALLVILFFITSLSSFAQFSVKGRVFDAESKVSLPNANVFLAKTTRGVSTDADGAFSIDGLNAIHYQLVVSFVGYKTEVIDVLPGQVTTFSIALAPLTETLNEIVVRAKRLSRAQWKRYYKIFQHHFIGLSENAPLCSIKNPKAIDFDKTYDTLRAYADSILVIENRGLGYNIKVLLEEYQYNTKTSLLYYEGPVVFTPLIPKDDEQEKLWAQNRLRAYYGSIMHFLRALYNHKAIDEGFYFKIITMEGNTVMLRGDSVFKVRTPILGKKYIEAYTITDYKRVIDNSILKYSGILEVKYLYEAESPKYQQQTYHSGIREKKPQTSQLELFKPALVSSAGTIYPVDAAEMHGYWSWDLVSESLPLDYDPEEDLKILKKK
jgi:hypothetical protein